MQTVSLVSKDGRSNENIWSAQPAASLSDDPAVLLCYDVLKQNKNEESHPHMYCSPIHFFDTTRKLHVCHIQLAQPTQGRMQIFEARPFSTQPSRVHVSTNHQREKKTLVSKQDMHSFCWFFFEMQESASRAICKWPCLIGYLSASYFVDSCVSIHDIGVDKCDVPKRGAPGDGQCRSGAVVNRDVLQP
jgi:hypothetical protein